MQRVFLLLITPYLSAIVFLSGVCISFLYATHVSAGKSSLCSAGNSIMLPDVDRNLFRASKWRKFMSLKIKTGGKWMLTKIVLVGAGDGFLLFFVFILST